MWIISGPFDGEVGDISFQKAKLLKTNKTYTLGRKDQPLLIANKKISHEHCDLIAGDHTTDDVVDPATRPTLEILNRGKKGRGFSILRGEQFLHVEPPNRETLEDGDAITLVSGVSITVHWRPICIYSPGPRAKLPVSLETCAVLGIKLLYAPHSQVTHHLTINYIANLSIAASLLSLSEFVKPEWLNEILRLGNLPEDDTGSLEHTFILPSISKFRPTFSPTLSTSHKSFSVWEPNEERVNLFRALRFICLHEKVTANDGDLRETIHRGGGGLENFDIHAGISKFHKALTRSRAKEGKSTVIVGDPDAMEAAVGQNTWKEYLSEAESFGLEILAPTSIVQAALEANISALKGSLSSFHAPEPKSHSQNEEPPAEIAEGPSETTRPRRTLTRATTRAPSREPSAPLESLAGSESDVGARPRRVLNRRPVNSKPIITGLEDSSMIIDTTPDLPTLAGTPPPMVVDIAAPTPARSSRLKRRPVRDETAQSVPDTFIIGETANEPPLKKFKALFEATNTEAQSSIQMDSMQYTSSSQTQTDTHGGQPPQSGFTGTSLTVLREEEEESQFGTIAGKSQRPSKRRLDEVEEDAEMEEDERASRPPASKRQVLENVNAVERSTAAQKHPVTTIRSASKPSSTNKSVSSVNRPEKDKQGAAPGKHDTDAAFLQAIASTKRGKKTEDAFDREFNKLKISKPELDDREPEEEWAVLAEFGDDTGLRGNFMVVVEMDVFRKDGKQKDSIGNHTWDGKPNFKKFKKKFVQTRRQKIELFASDENDYGMGPAYWKGGHSQAQSQTQQHIGTSQVSQVKSETQRRSTKGGRSQPIPESDDDDTLAPLRTTRSKPASRAGSAVPTRKAGSRSKAPAKETPLFLDSDGETQNILQDFSEDVGVDEDQTVPSSAEARPAPTRSSRRPAAKAKANKPPSKAKNPAAVIVDDDSDDEAVFKGFKGNKKTR